MWLVNLLGKGLGFRRDEGKISSTLHSSSLERARHLPPSLCLLCGVGPAAREGTKSFMNVVCAFKKSHLLSNTGTNPKSVSETFTLLHSLLNICRLLAEQNCFYCAALAFKKCKIFQLAADTEPSTRLWFWMYRYTHLLPASEGSTQDIADKINRSYIVDCLQAFIEMLKSVLLKFFSMRG